MSDQSGMSHDELIAALRSDMAATAAERDTAVQKREIAFVDLESEEAKHAEAEAEIARLEKAAAQSSMPDAQIKAGLLAIRTKFRALFS